MPRLLVVHHTPSPNLQAMFEAAVSGARTDQVEGVEVIIRPALTAAAAVLQESNGDESCRGRQSVSRDGINRT
jgi:hypothetical protein